MYAESFGSYHDTTKRILYKGITENIKPNLSISRYNSNYNGIRDPYQVPQ